MPSIIEASTTKPQLNITFDLDKSGSMVGEPMNQLNVAMAEAVQVCEEAAAEKEVQLLMRVISFNDHAEWTYGDQHSGVEHIDWAPLSAYGGTNTAEALDMTRSIMSRKYLGERNYRPVVILITDGESNNPSETVAAVGRLKGSLKSSTDPGKDKITRIAIGVHGANRTELENFASIGNIVREDGSVDENVPLVFDVDDVAMLKGLLKGVALSSIASSIGAGLEGGGNEIIIDPVYDSKETGDDWED